MKPRGMAAFYPLILARTTGEETIPQIFLGDHAIGGYRELCALDADGTLVDMFR